MSPLTLILAFLLGSLGQKDAETCPSDQDALMQIRASAMTSATDTDEKCENLVKPVYSSVDVGGGPFAVAQAGGQTPNNRTVAERFTMCGRAEGRAGANPGDQPAFCLCQVRPTAPDPLQVQGFFRGLGNNIFPTPVANEDWATITPAQPDSSAERCFRSGPSDPDIVTPSGFNFSCADPAGKTERDPHRSCTFNNVINFPAQHVQQIPPNTQVVGLCVQEVDNPGGTGQVRTNNATCRIIDTPARCSSSVSTFELPNFTIRTFSFLLKCCDPSMQGGGNGDPHIHSLRGAHYTLLSQGNFVAWSYSKQTGGFEAKLFASYAGPRVTTQALALKTAGSKGSEEMLEITAHDCQWRARSSDSDTWLEAESKDVSQSNLEVPPPTKGQGPLYMRASIVLKTSLDPVHKLAKLMTRCKPGDHINFRVEMFHKDDLQYVGGELGEAPADQKTAMLSSGRTRFQTDAKYEAGEWLSLGGSGEAALFLKAKTKDTPPHPSLLSTAPSCSKSETDMARGICQKHFGPKETLEVELFADCIFDVCSGGGEEAAASIADLLTA